MKGAFFDYKSYDLSQDLFQSQTRGSIRTAPIKPTMIPLKRSNSPHLYFGETDNFKIWKNKGSI